MDQARKIKTVITPQPVMEGAGVRLKRSIATRTLSELDPFLLFDHFGSENPDDYLAGFPMHPHRGIETVTYMLAGTVRHRDTLGNAGTIGPGDIQWMTSGRGILHEEMPQPSARLDGFQLWVNLPARLKMTAPRYQDISAAKIPVWTGENGVTIRVIAGEVGGIRGAVTDIAADPTYLDITLPANVAFRRSVPQGHAAFVYLFEGAGTFGIAEIGRRFRVGTEIVGARRRRLPRRPRGGKRRPISSRLRPAAQRADRPLRPLRHEHPGRDRRDPPRASRRNVHSMKRSIVQCLVMEAK
ncbi:MAG: pirin family protein [Candidatus Manganitrophus sp.]|nr:pirin family protein [Candidatus Manganitrophus sp.]